VSIPLPGSTCRVPATLRLPVAPDSAQATDSAFVHVVPLHKTDAAARVMRVAAVDVHPIALPPVPAAPLTPGCTGGNIPLPLPTTRTILSRAGPERGAQTRGGASLAQKFAAACLSVRSVSGNSVFDALLQRSVPTLLQGAGSPHTAAHATHAAATDSDLSLDVVCFTATQILAEAGVVDARAAARAAIKNTFAAAAAAAGDDHGGDAEDSTAAAVIQEEKERAERRRAQLAPMGRLAGTVGSMLLCEVLEAEKRMDAPRHDTVHAVVHEAVNALTLRAAEYCAYHQGQGESKAGDDAHDEQSDGVNEVPLAEENSALENLRPVLDTLLPYSGLLCVLNAEEAQEAMRTGARAALRVLRSVRQVALGKGHEGPITSAWLRGQQFYGGMQVRWMRAPSLQNAVQKGVVQGAVEGRQVPGGAVQVYMDTGQRAAEAVPSLATLRAVLLAWHNVAHSLIYYAGKHVQRLTPPAPSAVAQHSRILAQGDNAPSLLALLEVLLSPAVASALTLQLCPAAVEQCTALALPLATAWVAHAYGGAMVEVSTALAQRGVLHMREQLHSNRHEQVENAWDAWEGSADGQWYIRAQRAVAECTTAVLNCSAQAAAVVVSPEHQEHLVNLRAAFGEWLATENAMLQVLFDDRNGQAAQQQWGHMQGWVRRACTGAVLRSFNAATMEHCTPSPADQKGALPFARAACTWLLSPTGETPREGWRVTGSASPPAALSELPRPSKSTAGHTARRTTALVQVASVHAAAKTLLLAPFATTEEIVAIPELVVHRGSDGMMLLQAVPAEHPMFQLEPLRTLLQNSFGVRRELSEAFKTKDPAPSYPLVRRDAVRQGAYEPLQGQGCLPGGTQAFLQTLLVKHSEWEVERHRELACKKPTRRGAALTQLGASRVLAALSNAVMVTAQAAWAMVAPPARSAGGSGPSDADGSGPAVPDLETVARKAAGPPVGYPPAAPTGQPGAGAAGASTHHADARQVVSGPAVPDLGTQGTKRMRSGVTGAAMGVEGSTSPVPDDAVGFDAALQRAGKLTRQSVVAGTDTGTTPVAASDARGDWRALSSEGGASVGGRKRRAGDQDGAGPRVPSAGLRRDGSPAVRTGEGAKSQRINTAAVGPGTNMPVPQASLHAAAHEGDAPSWAAGSTARNVQGAAAGPRVPEPAQVTGGWDAASWQLDAQQRDRGEVVDLTDDADDSTKAPTGAAATGGVHTASSSSSAPPVPSLEATQGVFDLVSDSDSDGGANEDILVNSDDDYDEGNDVEALFD